MKEASRNTLVGLFVIASLAVLGTLMVWFGEVPEFLARNDWTLDIIGVRELRGVGQGSPVFLNGVEIGRVGKVDFLDRTRPDRGVVVAARIKKEFSVPKGAVARVYGATLGFGSGHVDIIISRGANLEPLVPDEASIPGEMRNVLGELISPDLVGSFEHTVSHIGNLAEAAKPVMEQLSLLLEPRRVQELSEPGAAERGLTANLSTVIERIDILVANVNEVLGDEHVQEDLKAVVVRLKDASEELRQTIMVWRTESQRLSDNLNAGVDRTEEHFDRSFAKLNQSLDSIDDAARNLSVIMSGIADGQGTIGLLANDPRLYEAAVLAMERLGAVLSDVKVITGRIKEDGYITVGQAPSGLLKKRIPVGPEAPGRVP
jgi:phospholipid/cholesterol/gamma-HCH transport system substrate-binding protein